MVGYVGDLIHSLPVLCCMTSFKSDVQLCAFSEKQTNKKDNRHNNKLLLHGYRLAKFSNDQGEISKVVDKLV